MPPHVTYWTGIWDPTREGQSKEVELLRRHFGSASPVVSFSNGQRSGILPGARVIRLSGNRWLTLRGLAALLEPRGDVTHAFGGLADWHLLRALGRRPMLFTVMVPGEPPDRGLLSKVSMFTAESEPIAAALRAAGIPADRIHVIYPGLELSRYRPAPPPPREPFRLLFASSPAFPREFDARGIPLLVDFARLRPDVEVVLLWRRWGDPVALRRAFDALNPPPNVRVDHRDVQDMAAVYHSVHATTACFAQGFGKSCPNSIVEGFACGRPALVTDTCGIAGLIASHGAGVVVPRTAAALAAGIETLRARYDDAATRARQLVEEKFDLTAVTRAYAALYARVAAGGHLASVD